MKMYYGMKLEDWYEAGYQIVRKASDDPGHKVEYIWGKIACVDIREYPGIWLDMPEFWPELD